MSDNRHLATQVPDAARLRTTVERLSSFPTRNSLSEGLAESCEWLADQLRGLPGVEVELMEYMLPVGRRVPEPTAAVQVIATIRGETDRRVLVGGHIDSLNLQVDPADGPAPGANDDASGVAVMAELARLFAGTRPPNTLMFAAFSAEEQGLLGSSALAERALTEGWKIDAVLNNDTVGSSSNKDGQSDPNRVRIFSEESPDHRSRELARIAEFIIRQNMAEFRAKLVLRRDRFGRGGDHTPFANRGFSAIRFIEVHEEFSRQHTPEDRIEFMDFDYLRNVAEANFHVMNSLAQAELPPHEVRVVRDQTHDTTLTWRGEPGIEYVVYHRETTSTVWQEAIPVGEVSECTVRRVNKDDHIFAVGSTNGIPVEAE